MVGIRSGALVASLLAGWALGLSTAGNVMGAEDKIRVLIIDGQNNHNWRTMTPPMKADLEHSGRFTVDVVTTPGPKSQPAAWDAFRPDFSKYDVVLSNYNGDSWPPEVRKCSKNTSRTEEAWRSFTPPITRLKVGPHTTR